MDKTLPILAIYHKSIGCIIFFIYYTVAIFMIYSIRLFVLWLWLSIVIVLITSFIIIHILLSRNYCLKCEKYVYPIFHDHYCLHTFGDMNRKIRNYLYSDLHEEISEIDDYVKSLRKKNLLKNDFEKEILKNNLVSLRIFEQIRDYKYTMISMGAIIEFLLIRYCEGNNISVESYTDPFGTTIEANKKHFVNYVQSAIINNIFGKKNSWYIIQNNLRSFRNYVHISVEVSDEKIDNDWYMTIKPHFERILDEFNQPIL